MTLEEILKSQGLSDEQIKTITGEMKQNKIFTSTEENLDIRYNKLKGDFDNQGKQLSEAHTLIERFKTGAKDNEKLQGQITAYETTIEELKEQLKQSQLKSEVEKALMSAGVQDIDYMTFKLKEHGELELDDEGHIKGIDDKIAGLKTQFPAQFESGSGGGSGTVIDENKLQKGTETKVTMTREDFNKLGYDSRVKLKQENPELYANMMKG
jgi:predicted RNase H-like nuclease (RuvC/YqgF family)